MKIIRVKFDNMDMTLGRDLVEGEDKKSVEDILSVVLFNTLCKTFLTMDIKTFKEAFCKFEEIER